MKEIEEANFIQTKELRINENKKNINALYIRIDHEKLHEYLDIPEEAVDNSAFY